MSTKIQWTEETWNPVVGCTKVSPGCTNCYAMRMAYRLKHIPAMKEVYGDVVHKTAGGAINWTGVLKVNDSAMEKPLRTKKPTMFFVNSMSDLFHDSVPFEVVHRVFTIMALCPQHTFQVLTKRPERMVEYFKRYDNGLGDMHEMDDKASEFIYYMYGQGGQLHPHLQKAGWIVDKYNSEDGNDSYTYYEPDVPLPNVWLGVSVESQKYADERIPLLLQVPAAVRFLSCEPLLGPVVFDNRWLQDWCTEHDMQGGGCTHSQHTDTSKFSKIHWVIAGMESGAGARPGHPDWVRSIRDQCKVAGTAFFFKQWGEWGPHPHTPILGENTGTGIFLRPDGTFGNQGDYWAGTAAGMDKVGKSKSGNMLDGIVYEEFPKTDRV